MKNITVKVLAFFTFMALVSSVFTFNTSTSYANDWTEVEQNPTFSVTSGDFSLYYGFIGGANSQDAVPGVPNVRIRNNRTGAMVNHLWAGGASTSNLLLAITDNNDEYLGVYSMTGRGSKIFTRGNEIRSSVDKDIFKRGTQDKVASVNMQVTLSPVDNDTIKHEYKITNNGDQPLKFVMMKSVDTDLNGNDYVPVRMLGNNEGAYIEAGIYRLDYEFRYDDSPTNFRNWYSGGYRRPGSDTWENIYIPFTGNSIYGTGAEAEGHQPDAVLPGRGDTGIWMKAKEVVLNPGESFSMSYDVTLRGVMYIEQDYTNLTGDVGNMYDDKIQHTSELFVRAPLSPQSITFISALPQGIKLDKDSEVKILDSEDNVLKTYTYDEVYNADTNEVTFQFESQYLVNNRVKVVFVTTAEKSVENTTVTVPTKYELTSIDSNVYRTDKEKQVPFGQYTTGSSVAVQQPSAGVVVTKFVDMQGKELAEPLESIGEFGEQYVTSPIEIKGYTYKKLGEESALANGEYDSELKTVIYVYEKNEQPKPKVKLVKKAEPKLPDTGLNTGLLYAVVTLGFIGLGVLKTNRKTN